MSHASLSSNEDAPSRSSASQGAEKTTLTSALNRLLPANGRVVGGSIIFDGQDILALWSAR